MKKNLIAIKEEIMADPEKQSSLGDANSYYQFRLKAPADVRCFYSGSIRLAWLKEH